MSQKTLFRWLMLEVLICFLPIVVIWILGGIPYIFLVFSSFLTDFNLMIMVLYYLFTIGLIIMGGVGIFGVCQIMNHIYRQGFEPADKKIHRKLYVGIFSLIPVNLGLIFNPLISPLALIFILPILTSIHLIYLTRSKKLVTDKSIFDDQVV